MKKLSNSLLPESILRNSGFVVMNHLHADCPVEIVLSYRNNRDGSVRWIWPEGSRQMDFSKFYFSAGATSKLVARINRILFALGLGSFISDGRLVLYADPSTVSYIRNKWSGIKF